MLRRQELEGKGVTLFFVVRKKSKGIYIIMRR